MNSYGCEAFEGLKPSAEIVGCDEVGEVASELIVAVVVEASDGGFLDGAVHPLDLSVIRYVICGAFRPAVHLLERPYGEPIRDAGRREHEGAGRPSIDSGLRARARYMAAPRDFPGCAASADQ